MVKLSDIAPAQKRVLVPAGDGNEVGVDVRGLTIENIRDLLERFPEAISLFDDKMAVQTLLRMGPRFVAAVIAMACGDPNSEAAEEVAASWPVGIQVEILNIVIRQTMPRGLAPFEELLKSLGLDPNTVRKASASAASSQPQSKASAPEGIGSPT